MRGKVERVADTKKSLDADRDSHEDSPTQTNVSKRVDEMWKGNGVDVTFKLESPDGVVDAATNDIENIESSKCYQKLVEAILEFWS